MCIYNNIINLIYLTWGRGEETNLRTWPYLNFPILSDSQLMRSINKLHLLCVLLYGWYTYLSPAHILSVIYKRFCQYLIIWTKATFLQPFIFFINSILICYKQKWNFALHMTVYNTIFTFFFTIKLYFFYTLSWK